MRNETANDDLPTLLRSMLKRLNRLEMQPGPTFALTFSVAAFPDEAAIPTDAAEGAVFMALDTGRIWRMTADGLADQGVTYEAFTQPNP